MPATKTKDTAAGRLPALEQAVAAAAEAVAAARLDLKVKRSAVVSLRVAQAQGASVDQTKLAAREQAVTAAESALATEEATERALAEKLAEETAAANLESCLAAGRDFIAKNNRKDKLRAEAADLIAAAAGKSAEARELDRQARLSGYKAFGQGVILDDDSRSTVLAHYAEAAIRGVNRTEYGTVDELRAAVLAPWRNRRGALAGYLANLGL